jgi:hypothetical protein
MLLNGGSLDTGLARDSYVVPKSTPTIKCGSSSGDSLFMVL